VLVVLALALFVSVWFDYSRLGYLGKIVGFPATLLVVGLFFEFCRLISIGKEFPLAALGALAVLVICTVIMFNAQLTALGLAAFGSLFLIVRLIWGQTRLLCRPYDRQIGFDSGGVDRPRDYLKRDDCSTEFNGRRLESLNGLGLPSRKSGGNYWATSLRRSFEDYYCSGVCVYLHSSDCQEIIGSDCIGCRVYRGRWRVVRFRSEVAVLRNHAAFRCLACCAAAILLNKEFFLAGRLRFCGLVTLLLLVPVGLLLPRYAADLP
jgi:hypothetical protein